MPLAIIQHGSHEVAFAKDIGKEVRELLKDLPYAEKIHIERKKVDRHELNKNGEWAIAPIMIEVRAYSKEKAEEIGMALEGLRSPYDHPIPIHFIQLLGFKSSSSGELVF